MSKAKSNSLHQECPYCRQPCVARHAALEYVAEVASEVDSMLNRHYQSESMPREEVREAAHILTSALAHLGDT